jgi:DNA-directed RNA polymerase specialized sigma24 family protein
MPDAELAAFYQEVFMPLVRRATWRHRLSKEDARDVVQDAFLVAIEKIDAAGNPKAWLIQVVDHLALNHQRKQIRRSKLLSKWSRGDLEPGADQRSVASMVQQP